MHHYFPPAEKPRYRPHCYGMLEALGAGQGVWKGSGVMYTWPGFRARLTIVGGAIAGAPALVTGAPGGVLWQGASAAMPADRLHPGY